MRNSSLGKTSLLPILAALVVIILSGPSALKAGQITEDLTYKLSLAVAFGGDSCSALGFSSETVTVDFSLKWDGIMDSIAIIYVEFSYDPSLVTFVRGEYDTTSWGTAYSSITSPSIGVIALKLQDGLIPTPSAFAAIASLDFSPVCNSASVSSELIFTASSASNKIVLVHPTLPYSPVESKRQSGSITIPATAGDPCCSVAGDANDDGSANIADATFLIARIFSGGSAPVCCGAADVNSDGSVNVSDVVYSIARIFSSGLAPVCGPAGIGCN